MAQQSLAVKYRPKTFDDVVEQDAIKAILTSQIETGTFKQAYLFCGPAGTGKTTAARIFANDINKGEGSPIEIDAASNNGVDNIREVIENSKRKSLDSDYKIYIIDEVHMLSIGAWNAMLKLIEEPPKGAIFIMCTTDPQKIPATILSRVQRYDFSKISLDNIYNRLVYIVHEENDAIRDGYYGQDTVAYSYETEAIQYISKLANGGMRDAITMLDKVCALSPSITVESAVRALGTVDYATHFDLLLRLNVGDSAGAVAVIEAVFNDGKDVKQFVKQFQFFVLDVCKFKMFESFKYTSLPALDEYRQKMDDEDYEDLVKVLEWVRQLNADIKWESNTRAIVQTAILLYGRE